MKIVAIKDMSAGNDSVGEMWKETKIFDENTPVKDIIQWGKEPNCSLEMRLKRNLIITEAEE